MDFNATKDNMVIDMVSNPVLQITFEALPRVEFG